MSKEITPEIWFGITIKWNPATRILDLNKDGGLSAFEAFGLLEAAKGMLMKDWLENGDPIED